MDQIQSKDGVIDSGQKPRRRLRTDQNNRDFSCGCGKSYLSYPALYTHLKQKHNGKAPNGTILPNNLAQKGNRGRPKREDNDKGDKDNQQSQSSNQPEEIIEEFLLFLDTLGGDYRNDNKFQNSSETAKYILDNYPLEIIEGQNKILDHIKEIIERKLSEQQDEGEDLFSLDNLIDEDIEDPDNIRKTPINKIFAYFLIDIGPRLSPQIYKEHLMNLDNRQLQYTIKNALKIRTKTSRNQNRYNADNETTFCEQERGEKMLVISNELILQLLPKYYNNLYEKNHIEFKIFGSSDEKLKNAVYITQHFSYWLYASKFTNSRLALFMEDE